MAKLTSPYDAVSPLDFRYYGVEEPFYERLRPYVSEETYIHCMAQVEAALAGALAESGVCDRGTADRVAQACQRVTAEEVWAEENVTQHNVRALVNCIRKHLPGDAEAQRVVHLFATSADIMDTANSLRLKKIISEVITPDLVSFMQMLIEKARQYRHTKQIGRTHGKHAEPITFGFALALYIERLGTRLERILEATKRLRGKMSGAVGAYNALSLWGDTDPAVFERAFLGRLGLDCPDSHISSQIVIPEPVQDLAHAVVSAFTVLANLADDVRHLHRSEIEEVQEIYEGERVGSSTMPHKTNPKNFENVKSLWKAFLPRMITVYMDGISEHQRDLTNSASSRFFIETLTAFDYALYRMQQAMTALRVNEARMSKNLDDAGSSVFAEPLYILLATYRKDPRAYDRIRELVRLSEKQGKTLAEQVQESSDLREFLKKLPDDKRGAVMDPACYVGASISRTEAVCDHWEVRLHALQGGA
jgi:adenylosuccinate lyase